MLELTVTAGGFSALLIQGIKWLWRTYIAKNPDFDFSPVFYALALPVLNILAIPLLALIGFTGFVMPSDWLMWGRSILQVLLATAISLVTYKEAIKPMATYRNTYNLEREE